MVRQKRVLLVATTTGYQTRAFDAAAGRLGVDLVFATDRCAVLDDPWRDRAIPIRFHRPADAVARVKKASEAQPFDAVLAVGDRPAELASHIRAALGLEGHAPEAAASARNKVRTRERLRAAGLPVPPFQAGTLSAARTTLAQAAIFPAVLKPVALSGSRGVTRVNDPQELERAIDRLARLLSRPDLRAERDPAHEMLLLESFIEGHEYAVEGLMTHGRLQVLAIFDKPDPLDGPFFEETVYITPAPMSPDAKQRMGEAVAAAAAAIGLSHGPIHAECRVNDRGVFVLEVAARPIGGLCARALRFVRPDTDAAISLEELLLRHALGDGSDGWTREPLASGVMMIPIPRRGLYRGVEGAGEATTVPGVDDVIVTAKPDQLLQPLPEGASYLGFIFARAGTGDEVDRALREAHRRLAFTIDPELPVVQSANG